MISLSGITFDGGEADDLRYCPGGHVLDDDGACDRCETVVCACDARAPAASLSPLACDGETLMACPACHALAAEMEVA